MAKPKAAAKPRPKPKGPFKTVERVTQIMSLERTDGLEEYMGDPETGTKTLPVVQKLYLDADATLIGVAPCGTECILAETRKELAAVIAFLSKVDAYWNTLG